MAQNNNITSNNSNLNDSYTKDLDLLLTQAYNEYKHITLDRPQVQQRYIHSYLWVTVAYIGAQTYLFRFVLNKFLYSVSDTIWPALLFFCVCMSFLYSGISFLVSVRSLRGNMDMYWPLYGLMKLVNDAYDNKNSSYKLRIILLNRYARAIKLHKEAVNMRAQKLRYICDSLTYSIAFSIFSRILYFTY